MAKMKGLGRGLNALIQPEAAASEDLLSIAIDRLQPGKYQPRTHLDTAALEELAQSLKQQGIIQPIVVRPTQQGYEILAGERRWRAAQLAGFSEVPALVRDVTDQTALAIALIENIQRQELSALEEAQGLQRLIQEFGLTHEAAAETVGRSRSAVTNLLRLLQLDKGAQTLLGEGALDMGHARALLALPQAQQTLFAARVADRGFSVRQTEAMVKTFIANSQKPPTATTARALNSEQTQTIQTLSDQFETRVSVQHNANGSGRLSFEYGDLAQWQALIARLRTCSRSSERVRDQAKKPEKTKFTSE